MPDDVLARCDTRDAWDPLAESAARLRPGRRPTSASCRRSRTSTHRLAPEPYVGFPVTLTGTMARPRVSLSWTPAAVGASSVAYTLSVRGPLTLRVPLGPQTRLSADAPDGVYSFVVEAAFSTGIVVRSNTTVVPVGMFALPGPPVGLAATTAGSVVTFQWAAAGQRRRRTGAGLRARGGTGPGCRIWPLPLGGGMSVCHAADSRRQLLCAGARPDSSGHRASVR
jgi:hypothetical protein